jgi:uncharacterized iron-regulated protein
MRVRLDPVLLALTLSLVAGAPVRAADDAAPGAANATAAARGRGAGFAAVDLHAALAPAALADRLHGIRVVFVGETHTRYDHHLNQLEIIRALHERDASIAIGVEYFERRFQPKLDDYIEGRISEPEFLRATQYFRNWGYDYRLYAPIFRYAREQHIPVRALNVPRSLPSAVAKTGIGGLSAAQRAELPKDIEPAGDAYETRLRTAFEAHGDASPIDFEHFVEAQLVWDEGMAETAAAYLEANAARRMVILAGAGHIEFGSGIPSRLTRRIHAPSAIVLSTSDDVDPEASDYLLLSREQDLPPAGALGVQLEDVKGTCSIRSVRDGGAADEAGLEKGDRLVAVAGEAVSVCADARVALWDKQPGDRVRLEVRRKRRSKAPVRAVEIELEAAQR